MNYNEAPHENNQITNTFINAYHVVYNFFIVAMSSDVNVKIIAIISDTFLHQTPSCKAKSKKNCTLGTY